MTRVNGHAPRREKPIEIRDEDCLPPHLPYVLLCRTSGARCGWKLTVNKGGKWRESIGARDAHEALCPTLPAYDDAYFDTTRKLIV